MADVHWEQLLAYRRQAGQWQQRGLGLAATRLRVAKLLESAFGYGLDDVEADVDFNGTKADFVLLHGDSPWASVIVRAMADGLAAVPPPEAFVIADASGVAWCWVTDGLGVQVYHIAPDLMPSRIIRCHLLSDSDIDLQTAWRLLHHESVSAGDLEAYRQARERPDDEAVAAALLSPDVLDALHDALAADYPRPGTASELAIQVRRVLRDKAAASPNASLAALATPTVDASALAVIPEPSVTPAPSSALAIPEAPPLDQPELPPSSLEQAPPAPDRTVEPIPEAIESSASVAHGPSGPAPVSAEAVDLPPAPSPTRQVASSLSALLPKRRRRTNWRVEAGSNAKTLPPVSPRNGPRDTEVPAFGDDTDTEDDSPAATLDSSVADDDLVPAEPTLDVWPIGLDTPVPTKMMLDAPSTETDASLPTEMMLDAPSIETDASLSANLTIATPTAAPDAESSVAPPAPAGPIESPRPQLASSRPTGTSLRSAIERQRQAHERLRQNLRDLRENRARLQDALAELREDYPERFTAMLDAKRQQPSEPPVKTPSSWIRLGPVQAFGNGYWEQLNTRITSFR